MFEMQIDFFRPRHGSPEERAAITRTLLETLAPGADLAHLLATVNPPELDMYDLVSFAEAAERQAAWTQARQLVAVGELAGRRFVTGPHGEPPDTALPDGAINEFAADEVAAVLSLSRTAGQKRVWLAGALSRLPATAAAFAAGDLTLPKVWAIAETLCVLDDDAAGLAEARVLGRAPEQTLGNLKRALARAVAAADPTAATRRAAKARAERRVMLTPQPDGMCEFWALLPAPEAMALFSAVTTLADKARTADRAAFASGHDNGSDKGTTAEDDKGACVEDATDGEDDTHAGVTGAEVGTDLGDFAGAGDGGDGTASGAVRTLDQARADVLADIAWAVLDRDDLPRSHRRRPHIQITLAATTALGLDDQPGELAGYGPITAQAARQVAAEGTWRRLLTDPATGGLLDYGRTVYDPPQNLTDHVITRDQTCRGLGCRIPAQRCDLDHTIRFPEGPTAAHNLSCECRRCHIRETPSRLEAAPETQRRRRLDLTHRTHLRRPRPTRARHRTTPHRTTPHGTTPHGTTRHQTTTPSLGRRHPTVLTAPRDSARPGMREQLGSRPQRIAHARLFSVGVGVGSGPTRDSV